MANSHLATKMKLGSMQSKQAAQAVKKALEEDPTVFQYDEVYDDMERDRVEKKEQAKGDRKPKYMHELMKAAERRKRENERRIEVQVQRDLEKEGDMYKDKEAFVTGAYKRKMEELKRIEEEEKRQDAIDELTDVSKQKDLSGFYRHLYRTTMSEDKPKCEVKKTAADSSSDVPGSEDKKSRHHDEEESSSKRIERRDSSPYEAEDKRKSHSSSHKDSDAKDYHRERSDKDRSSHRHHHHHHHRDRSRSRERDREKDRRRDRDSDRHRDREYEKKDKDRERRDRDRDRDERNKHRDRDRDRDHDRRRERDHHHRYHPYSRKDSGKNRRSRTRSRSPAHAHARKQSSHHQSSTPSKYNQSNGTKENARLPNPASKAKDTATQAERTLKHINEHPVWRKRTVGDAFNAALERYFERKRSGVISAEISKEK